MRLRKAGRAKKAIALAGVVLAASNLAVFKGKDVLAEENYSSAATQARPQVSEDLGEEELKLLEELDRREKEEQRKKAREFISWALESFPYSKEMKAALEYEKRMIEYLPLLYKDPKKAYELYLTGCESVNIITCAKYDVVAKAVRESMSKEERLAYGKFWIQRKKIIKEFIRRLANNYPRELDRRAFCSELGEFVRPFGAASYSFAREAEKQGLCKKDEIYALSGR